MLDECVLQDLIRQGSSSGITRRIVTLAQMAADAGAELIVFTCSTFTSDRTRAATLAAVMYTLLGTVKLNGINRQRDLRHVLERIAYHPINRIDELLPWVVAAKWEADASAKARWHPLTPMTDANLVRVLQAQTQRRVGLVDHRSVAAGKAAIRARIAES